MSEQLTVFPEPSALVRFTLSENRVFITAPSQYALLLKKCADLLLTVADGKGKARHEEADVTFAQQIACRNAKDFGVGAPMSQIRKKLEEFKRIRSTNKRQQELLSIAFYALVAALEEGGEL